MHPMTRRTLTCAAGLAILSLMRSEPGAVPAAAPNRSGGVYAADTAQAMDEPPADVRVGHSIKQLVVTGSRSGENRRVDVHLWYPADATGFPEASKTFYTSALYGAPLIAELWDPLSWKVEAEVARENVAIDPGGRAFPVIVFSHGATNEPIDYAYTLELIAAAGFVVAAPAHVNNTQDDVRTDYVNAQAGFPSKPPVLSCRDGLPPPCARTDVPRSLADRVRDISAVLNALPVWYGDRVDVSRAGVMGHSRGTVTALTAAGGSVPAGTTGCGSGPWDIDAEPRIKAVMGLAIGAAPITFCANLANVTVPALLVAGALDANSTPAVSEAAYKQIGSAEKEFVILERAVHRSFDSTYCAQTQAAGAVAQGNTRALLDKHTIQGMVIAPISGVAMDYCSLASFTNPVDIRPLVTSITGFNFAAQQVPRTGLDTEVVKQWVTERAVAFFGDVLKRDPTPPVIEHSISGTIGTGGWYTSDVAVSWTVTGPGFGHRELERVQPDAADRRHGRRRLHLHRFVRRRLVLASRHHPSSVTQPDQRSPTAATLEITPSPTRSRSSARRATTCPVSPLPRAHPSAVTRTHSSLASTRSPPRPPTTPATLAPAR